MKKILLSFSLFMFVLFGKAQTVLNEVYTDPNTGKSEFFELYNSSTLGSQNVDCFTILSFFKEGENYGWYVIDLPNLVVGPKGYFVGASASPFQVQSQTGVVANFNWNAPSAGGSLKKFVNVGGVYQDQTASIPVGFNDVFQPINGIGAKYTILVYVNGVLNNGLTGQDAGGAIPAVAVAMPTLLVPMSGCSGFNAVFSGLTIVEGAQPAVGTDNGYIRENDGKCGSWVKSSSSVNHTPGITNGTATGLTGSLTTTELMQCNTGVGVSKISYSITGFTGDVSLAADFPVTVQFYWDKGTVGLDLADVFLGNQAVASPSATVYTYDFPQTYRMLIVYATGRGCFDKVISIPNSCAPLPVKFKSFTATRTNSTNVAVKWETLSEENAAGFVVERNVRGTWEQVSYLPSLAAGGNSNSALTYQINDLNPARGVSQYRIRQEDLDGAAKVSDIRSVRGEGQKGSTIVYPNPSSDGRVNVVFAGGEITKRNVSVQDMSGRTVKQWSNYSNNNIQIENLTPGLYTIRIVDIGTGEQSVEKIVVNKR